jgi:hypothetical protein
MANNSRTRCTAPGDGAHSIPIHAHNMRDEHHHHHHQHATLSLSLTRPVIYWKPVRRRQCFGVYWSLTIEINNRMGCSQTQMLQGAIDKGTGSVFACVHGHKKAQQLDSTTQLNAHTHTVAPGTIIEMLVSRRSIGSNKTRRERHSIVQ